MKKIDFMLILVVLIFIVTCCENDQSTRGVFDQNSLVKLQKTSLYPPDGFFTGRIIVISCGGSVIQFMDTDSIIGEEWINYFSTDRNYQKYFNCVNALNISQWEYDDGDTLYFEFRILDFSKGDKYTGTYKLCDIGGLPKINVELSNVITKTRSNY